MLSITVGSMVGTMASCGNQEKDYPVEEGATEITIYKHDQTDWENEFFEASVRKYNENLNDGVQIVYQLIPEANYNDKIKSMREAGKAPEIFEISYGNMFASEIDFAASKILPLDDYLSDEAKNDLTDFARELVTFNGKIYGVPKVLEASMLLFYNKDMLQQAGASVPTTWTEMYDTCQKLESVVNQYQRVLGTPLGTAMGWATWGLFYNATGERAIADDWKSSNVYKNKESYKKFLEYYTGLYSNGWATTSDTSGGYNEIIYQICENKMAMTFAGSYAVSQIATTYPEMMDKIGVTYAPTENGGYETPTSAVGGWAYVVDATAATKTLKDGTSVAQAAVDFLDWMTRDIELMKAYYKTAYYSKYSGFKSVQAALDEDEDALESPFYEVIKNVSDHAIAPACYSYSITTAHQTMVESIFFETSTIDEAIKECDKKVEDYIDVNGYRNVTGTKNPKASENQ